MDSKDIKKKAAELRSQLGGTIFAFPIDEEYKFSKYAVVVFLGGEFHVYPECTDIAEASIGVLTTIEQLKINGVDVSYEKDVRFVSYEAQMNAPSVTMRKLKKSLKPRNGLLLQGVDVTPLENGEYAFSARGLIKFSFFEWIDEKNPIAYSFLDEYFKLLAMRRYGKSLVGIRREVKQMDKETGSKWIEETYEKYVRDPQEIIDIMNKVKNKKSPY